MRNGQFLSTLGALLRVLPLGLALLMNLTACSSDEVESQSSPFESAAAGNSPGSDYIIGPFDKLSVRVFDVKDLSLDGLQVDASGQIVLPLVGSVTAAGKTSQELSHEIARLLAQHYLQHPEVIVYVDDASSQRITIEGEVKSSGVFKMSGKTTLMQALALAGGPSDEADLHEVAVIRIVNGERVIGICDYAAIREGKAPDPSLRGEDVVVLRGSLPKTVWQELLRSLPLFGLFAGKF